MGGYRFRVVFATDPMAFWRDVVVGGERTLTEFQSHINDTIGLDQNHHWFFGRGTDYWESSVKFEDPAGYRELPEELRRSETVYDAAETTITEIVDELDLGVDDRICYVFDYMANWRFFLTLKEELDAAPGRTPPTVDQETGPTVEYPIRQGNLEIVPAIRTASLTRRFGSGEDAVVAVDDLNLTVGRGEVFGFLGTNGAGKSTTISMLLGFLDPTDGEATVLGYDVTSESKELRSRLGLLPEGYDVYENLTALEHLQSAIDTKGVDDDPDHIVDRVGLEPADARRPAGDYSKGMRQRLALGVALVGDPELLILDEPSSGLDPKGVKLLRNIVREEADRGATVFFSSHVLSEVENVCDRVGILKEGRLIAVDTIDNLRQELAATSNVEVTVDSVPDVSAIGDVDGVRDVNVDGDIVSIACSLPGAKMPALRRLDEGTTVQDISIADPSLETLFEEYTGSDSVMPADSEWSEPATGETT